MIPTLMENEPKQRKQTVYNQTNRQKRTQLRDEMAITSPFKRLSHSRESSREEKQQHQLPGALQARPMQPTQRIPNSQVRLSPQRPLQKSNTVSSTISSTSALAQQYESDKNRLIKYCFSAYGKDGVLVDSYITHVRVIEDAAYPSSKPPANSPANNKKNRVLVLAVKGNGEVLLHKGRENPNGSFQIGRSWSLAELTLLQRETTSDTGFTAKLGKSYYWETNSPKERQVFITSLVRVYRKFKSGLVPQLVNWDLSIFGLDSESYKVFVTQEAPEQKPSVSSESVKATSSQRSIPTRDSLPEEQPPQQSQPQVQSQPRASVSSRESGSSSKFEPDGRRPSVVGSGSQREISTRQKVMTATATGVSALPSISMVDCVTDGQQPAHRDSKRSLESRKSLDPRGSTPSVPEATVEGPNEINDNSLKGDLNEKMRELNLDKESTAAPLNASLDVLPQENPAHKDQVEEAPLDKPYSSMLLPESPPSSEQSSSIPSSSDQLNKQKSVNETFKEIHIIGHTKSRQEYEEEQEESDDGIPDFYQETEEEAFPEYEADSPLDKPSSIHGHGDGPESATDEFSFDDSQINTSQDMLRVSSTTRNLENEAEQINERYEDSNFLKAEPTYKLEIKNRTRRGDTVTSAIEMNMQNSLESSLDDIFENINWDPNDDADSLSQKILQELATTEYDSVKQMIDIPEKSSNLSKFSATIVEESDKLQPLLTLFAVELGGFVKNIQHIEKESQGLQVESVNKKKLWKQLQNILNTVAVDERSLRFLLDSDIDRDMNRIEPILAELQSAINAIKGSDEDADLGDMRALQERRAKYESVITDFLRKLIGDLNQRFQYTFNQLLQSDPEKMDIRSGLSRLLVYSSFTIFIKDISEESFDELIGGWEGTANTFYEKVLGVLNQKLSSATKSEDKFSLANVKAFKAMPTSTLLKKQIDSKQNLLRQRFGLAEESDTTTQESNGVDNAVALSLLQTLQRLQNHIILQQDFVLKFFHISTDNLNIASFIETHPVEERLNILGKNIDSIETDRENARELYQSMVSIFQPGVDTVAKSIVQNLRYNQKNSPMVILYLELFEKRFGSSNQEFLLRSFKSLAEKLKSDWTRFIDNEIKVINKSTLAPKLVIEVSPIVRNFTSLIAELESSYIAGLPKDSSSINSTALESRALINNAYEQLSTAITSNLENEGDTTKNNNTERLTLHIEDGNRYRLNHLVNLIQNSNWLVETLTPLKLTPLNNSINAAKKVYTTSRDLYVRNLLDQNFGKISTFVTDVESLIKESNSSNLVDPSKRNAYSKTNLSKIVSSYDSKEINKIVSKLREQVTSDFKDSTDSNIQKQVIDKVWSSLQAQFVSTAVGLEQIATRYYRDVDTHFIKKDIIAAFNAARL